MINLASLNHQIRIVAPKAKELTRLQLTRDLKLDYVFTLADAVSLNFELACHFFNVLRVE